MAFFRKEKYNRENKKIRLWKKIKNVYLSGNLNDRRIDIINADKAEAPNLNTRVTVTSLDTYIHSCTHPYI